MNSYFLNYTDNGDYEITPAYIIKDKNQIFYEDEDVEKDNYIGTTLPDSDDVFDGAWGYFDKKGKFVHLDLRMLKILSNMNATAANSGISELMETAMLNFKEFLEDPDEVEDLELEDYIETNRKL